MDPFSFDAGKVNPSEIPHDYILKTKNIKQYLEATSKEEKLFLIGPKGCGKTLLIRYKAYLVRRKLENEHTSHYLESTSEDLVESLEFSMGSLSRSELGLLVSLDNWISIWTFSLTYLILKRTGIGLPARLSEIDERFEGLNNLSVIVGEILNYPQEFIGSDFFKKTNAMIGKLDELQHSVVLFVDRLDQALNSFLTSDTYNSIHRDDGQVSPFDIWRNAQYGLLQACYSMSTARNRHVKIFATAREEALSVSSQTVANVTNYCLALEYLPHELETIFKRNIQKIPGEFLRGTKKDSDWVRFFGFERMKHLKACDQNGERREEKVFGFICRHSFERPREVLRLGYAIYHEVVLKDEEKRTVDESHIERIRRIVNNAAYEQIVKDYKSEFIPYFREDYLDLATKVFSNNLIPYKTIKEADQDMVNYMYRAGLLGYARQGKQEFEATSKYIYEDEKKYPIVDYYHLHPALDRRMQMEYHYDSFYNEVNIIGKGYPFYPPAVFVPELEKEHGVEHYLPKKISGNSNGNSTLITPDRKLLFSKLFNNAESQIFTKKVNGRIQDVFRMLTIVGRIWCVQKVHTAFKVDFSDYRTGLDTALSKLHGRTDYSARINEADTLGAEMFLARVFGRMVTAGLLLYTDLEQVEIHHLLRNFDFAPNARKISTEAAVKYMRKAFFLKGIPYSYPLQKHEKDKILSGLSDFERIHLERWSSNFKNHDMMVNEQLNADHRTYLERVLD